MDEKWMLEKWVERGGEKPEVEKLEEEMEVEVIEVEQPVIVEEERGCFFCSKKTVAVTEKQLFQKQQLLLL